MKLPYFIVLEGIDGSGTTTQVANLEQWLKEQDLRPLTTSEPDELNPVGKLIRKVLNREKQLDLSNDDLQVALSLLFTADRFIHTAHLKNVAEDYDVIISDRYKLSTISYQTQSPKVTPTWLHELHYHCPEPDLVILLDCEPKMAFSRLSGPKDIMEEKLEFQTKVAKAYSQNLTTSHGEDTVVAIVDARLSESEVSVAVQTIVHTAMAQFKIKHSR